MTQVICNQAKVCSQRDNCPAAKPHNSYICTYCMIDALAECIPVEKKVNGFDSSKQAGHQPNAENNHD